MMDKFANSIRNAKYKITLAVKEVIDNAVYEAWEMYETFSNLGEHLANGFVKGIENYSRYLTNREPGEQPATLLDYFSDDFLLLVDESHQTLPQVRGMYNGDRARKEVLVEHGFRLPSAPKGWYWSPELPGPANPPRSPASSTASTRKKQTTSSRWKTLWNICIATK